MDHTRSHGSDGSGDHGWADVVSFAFDASAGFVLAYFAVPLVEAARADSTSTTFFAGTSVTTTLADGRSAFASSRALFAVTSALVMLTDTFAAGALRLACLAQPSEFPTGTDAGAFAQLTV